MTTRKEASERRKIAKAARGVEAIAIAMQLAADRKRILGPDHPDTLTARGNLAAVLWPEGRTAEAFAIQKKLVADYERTLGPDHPDTLTARANLAAFHRSGRTAEYSAIQKKLV